MSFLNGNGRFVFSFQRIQRLVIDWLLLGRKTLYRNMRGFQWRNLTTVLCYKGRSIEILLGVFADLLG